MLIVSGVSLHMDETQWEQQEQSWSARTTEPDIHFECGFSPLLQVTQYHRLGQLQRTEAKFGSHLWRAKVICASDPFSKT